MKEEYLQLYRENKGDIPYFATFILLVLIYENTLDILEDMYAEDYMLYTNRVRFLELGGYVKWHGPNPTDISLRNKGEELFAKLSKRKHKPADDVHLWIDEWRALFPEGVNNAGYRYRGNKLEVQKKMIKFVNNYDYSKEEIFQATKRYIDRFAVKGYNYMQQAHYFIEKKDAGSTLASECETLKESKSQDKKITYGRTIV